MNINVLVRDDLNLALSLLFSFSILKVVASVSPTIICITLGLDIYDIDHTNELYIVSSDLRLNL